MSGREMGMIPSYGRKKYRAAHPKLLLATGPQFKVSDFVYADCCGILGKLELIMEIPPYLEEQVSSGKVVLILGAGASYRALDSNGKTAPSSNDLRDLLADRFLGGKLKSRSLSQVAEYAIGESDISTVQDYIRSLFDPLQPTEAHKLLPTFRWWGLATTNYDRIIETAYAQAAKAAQQLIPVIENGDRIDLYTRDSNTLLLLKLHGCITRTANPDCPLILTIDQYIDHRSGRSRLFDRLTDWGYEHVFVFIGHSLQDTDIRQILKDLTKGTATRARFFCVVPDADPIEQRAFELQRITVLSATFEEFMKALDSRISCAFRGIILTPPSSELPIAERFRDRTAVPSKNVVQFLTVDADYVNAIQVIQTIAPGAFYRGFNPGFSAIEQQLDVPRRLADEILTDIFLIEEARRDQCLELVLIRAHAGGGKTVLMRRLAWDAARDYQCLSLFMKLGGIINVAALQELVELCDCRVFLFVDDAADRVRELDSLLQNIGAAGRRLTVVAAERINEWNVSCQTINPYVTHVYELRYLITSEIDALLELLAKHNAEGKLGGRTLAEKKEAFEERAGRQLLVALHEATLGKPFVEIIQNEFENIWPPEAKQIYLTICVLNRLNVPVRAGIISRIHGVPFEDFKQRVFHPLEHIVQAQYDGPTRDYVYQARHPHIAQMVFDTVLTKQEDRFDSYIRCLGALNIDYSTDRIAFRQMTRAKTILEMFPDHQLAIAIYNKAVERAGDKDGALIHQMALYELNRPNANLVIASERLTQAAALRPFDISIKHSLAELHLRLSESARTGLEKEKYLRDATKLCLEYNSRAGGETYGYVTLAKIGLSRLEDALKRSDPVGIEQAVKEVEQSLQDGLQRFPGDAYLREAEARMAELIADSARAVAALEKAFQTNPRSSFIATRLAQWYRRSSEFDKAKKCLENALAANSNERRLHYAYAKLLMETGAATSDVLLYHLERSFLARDANYDAQLLFGRQLFIQGEVGRAKEIFKTLKGAPTSPEVRLKLYYPLGEEFHGEIARMESTYCFIIRDGAGDWIYAYRDNVGDNWSTLSLKVRVSFRIAFSFAGPSAFDVRLESIRI
jgi:hypothetical protein